MNIEEILEEITPDMFPKPYNLYAKAIGVKNLYRFVKLTGGKTIYLPKLENCFRTIIKKRLLEEYESGGQSLQKLADKYEISKNTVRAYIRNK